ncbi:MAG: zinc dependent phospholipase C family protein [Thermodesulfovibrionales bacterium]
MKTLKVIFFLSFFFVPSMAFAWGPLTHFYLGSEILSLGSLIPAGIYSILKKYKHDFLYGNLMADIVIGKKYLPEDKNSHSWDVALNLFDSARTRQQKAFVYGYLSHLAADTVAHGKFTGNRKNIGHTLIELKADSIIDKRYWIQAITINKSVQQRNDVFLERSLERAIFSFKTNKRIFKGMLFLSCFNQKRVGDLIERNLKGFMSPSNNYIQSLHDESIKRIIDVLRNGRDSKVFEDSPIVRV